MSNFRESLSVAMEPLKFVAEQKAQEQLSKFPDGYEPFNKQLHTYSEKSGDGDIESLGKITVATGLGAAAAATAVEAIFDVSDTLASGSFAVGVGAIAIGSFIYVYGKTS